MAYWESQFLGRLIRSPRVLKERGVWNSQGGERGLGLSKWKQGSGILKEEERTNLFLSTFLQFSSVWSLSHVRLFATPRTAACQASLSITNSWSSLKLTSIESVMPSSHLIFCHPILLLPQSLPASESFPMSQLFAWGGQSTGVSSLASFLSKNNQDRSPLEWTGWVSW